MGYTYSLLVSGSKPYDGAPMTISVISMPGGDGLTQGPESLPLTLSPSAYSVQYIGLSTAPSARGSYSVKITITTDSYRHTSGETVTQTLNITEGAPIITAGQTASGKVGTAFSFTPALTDSANRPVTNWSATGLPSWAVINTTTGAITGTPTTIESATLTLTATGPGGEDSETVTISITAGTPLFAYPLLTTLERGEQTSISPSITDSANRPITSWSATGLPAGLTINTSTGEITGAPTTADSFTATITATGPGGSSTKSASFEVTNPFPIFRGGIRATAIYAGATEGIALYYGAKKLWPFSGWEPLAPPETIEVGVNATYIGFGARTGGVTDEHWVHDFTFSSPFNEFSAQDLFNTSSINGNAAIVNNSGFINSRSIRLTPNSGNQSGSVYLNAPFIFKTNQGALVDWESRFVVSMGRNSSLGADGMGFVLQSHLLTSPAPAASSSMPKAISLWFDTYVNSGDIAANVLEISLGDSRGVGGNSLVQKVVPFTYRSSTAGTNRLVYCWITFRDRIFSVYVSETPAKPASPLISVSIDLRAVLENDPTSYSFDSGIASDYNSGNNPTLATNVYVFDSGIASDYNSGNNPTKTV